MKVFICDDESNELKNIERIITEYAKEHLELLIGITCFSDPFELLENVDKNGVPDIAGVRSFFL